jgi:hypothetical protein
LSVINESEKQYKSSVIRLKDLVQGLEKDDIWTLYSQSLVNLKYKIYDHYVKDILEGFNFKNIFINDAMNENCDSKINEPIVNENRLEKISAVRKDSRKDSSKSENISKFSF